MDVKRVFLIVLDSVGAGECPDSAEYGDAGSDTIGACYASGRLNVPNMRKLGLYNIDGVHYGETEANPSGAYCKLRESSKGKDTTIGHWEIAGIISERPLPTYPDGFPDEVIAEFERQTGRKTLCNKVYSGTEVIKDYGEEHMKTGALIVYTSADSVFQIAAHEDIVPVEELYSYCETARKILTGKHGVGRVIARPFTSVYPFTRTTNRHDFSLVPPKKTMLDCISEAGLETVGVGKINDIFASKGITSFVRTKGNDDGIDKTLEYLKKDFTGLCFINLVDYDMLYGHRNNVAGYTDALCSFDKRLGEEILPLLKEDDVLMITADHGCDPSTPSTDHSREYIPLLICGEKIAGGVDLRIRKTFSDIGATVCDLLGVRGEICGESFAKEILL